MADAKKDDAKKDDASKDGDKKMTQEQADKTKAAMRLAELYVEYDRLPMNVKEDKLVAVEDRFDDAKRAVIKT